MRHPKTLVVLTLAAAFLFTGCKSKPGHSGVDPKSLAAPFELNGSRFEESYKLSNGTVEVVIIPRIGRLISYGYVGGPNELWINPLARFELDKPKNWINWGGDKTWIWPQDGWRKLPSLLTNWPPPMDMQPVNHTVSFASANTLRTVSSPIPDLNVSVVREYRLAATGTELTVKTTFVHLDGSDISMLPGATPWTIAQLPWSPFVVAVTSQAAESAAIAPLGAPLGTPVMKNQRIDVRQIQLLLPESGESQKVGVDAERLAALSGHGTLLVLSVGPGTTKLPYPTPIDKAQVYSEPRVHKDRPADVGPYVELEFTAPPGPAGKPSVLEVVWTLHRATTDQEARAVLNALSQ